MHRFALAAAMLLALAACQNRTTTAPPPTTSGSGSSSILSNEPPGYGATTPQQRALQGCASGQSADILHQDRPGGSDYDAARCRTEGY